MIVSREHYPSLASMPSGAIHEYGEMVRMFFGLPQLGSSLLEAEHGSTTACHAGACVAHAHVHLLPGFMKYQDCLDGRLRIIQSFSNLEEIQGCCQPYILLRANLGNAVMFDAESVPTQAIRRVLCDRLSQPNWDWRIDPRSELIEETLVFWKAALSNVPVT
jgi:hypothetical protein